MIFIVNAAEQKVFCVEYQNQAIAKVFTVAEMKHQDRFLGFHYVDCEYESEHLQSSSDEKFTSKQERLELIRELTSEGLSIRAIEAQTGISKSTVDRLIKQL